MQKNIIKIINRQDSRTKEKMGRFFFSFVILFSLIFSLFSPLFVDKTEAVLNKQINYQGKLTNSSGVAVTNGTYNMEFKLYDSGSSVLWTETRTSSNRVQVTSGLFSIMLGEVASLASVDFNQTLYLGVNIGGTAVSPSWDGEMSPRKKLGIVPAAVEAEKLGGFTPSQTPTGSNIPVLSGGALTMTGSINSPTFDASSAVAMNIGGSTQTALTLGRFGANTEIKGAAVVINSAAASALNITSGTTGELTLDSGTTGVINIGTGIAGKTINIGTSNAAADTIIIGSALDTIRLAKFTTDGFLKTNSSNGTLSVDTNTYLTTTNAGTTYVPYTGANSNVNLGTYSLTTPNIIGGSSTTQDLSFQTTTGIGATGADMHFLVGNAGGTEAMTILNNGNVGIGTNNPTTKLDIYGRSLFYNDYASYAAKFLVYGDYGEVIRIGRSGVSETAGIGYPSDGTLSIITTSNERMRINSSGYVGIGTTSPTYKLEVNGTASTDGIRTTSGLDFNLVADPTAPTLALINTPGNVNAGTHTYYVSYTTAIGETHAARQTTPITTDAANGQVTVTIPVSTDPRVTGRNIYRTKAGGNYWDPYFLASVANNSATTYVDNIADASLSGSAGVGIFRPNTTNNLITINGAKSMLVDNNATYVGVGAGAANPTAGNLLFVGNYAGQNLTSGYATTFLGSYAGQNTTTGVSNSFIGAYAGTGNTTGGGNNYLGSYAGNSNQTGSNNVAIGTQSLQGVATNSHNGNTTVGAYSMFANTTGGTNSVLGNNALYANTTGSNNVAIGYLAGRYHSDGTTALTDAENSVYIGTGTRGLNNSDTNSIVVGYNSIGKGANTAVWGNTATTQNYFYGSIGMNGNAPTARLTLPAGTATASSAPLKFTSGTVLGTTEAGAVEYDGTHLYFTATNGGSRYQLDQQGGTGANALGTYIVQTATNAPANSQVLASLGTGIVKNTTTTGALSIAVAGDFPTLNQNTTGSAATLTTSRNINGVGFNGSSDITVPVNNTDDTTTAATMYPLWTATVGGNYAAKVSSTKLTFNPSTGMLTSTGFTGPLTGTASKATNLVGGNGTTLLGSLPYQSNTDVTTLLSPNTSSTKNFLTMTGTGTNGAAPAWGALANGDIPATLTGKTYNGLTLTAAGTGWTIAGGTTSKTLTVNNNLGLSGTDGSTLNIGAGGTLGTGAYATIANYIPYTGANSNVNLGTYSLTTPNIIGGSSTTQDLSFQTTTGIGATGADMHFLVGNAGGTEAMTILNSGNIGIGATSPESKFTIYKDQAGVALSESTAGLLIKASTGNTQSLRFGVDNTNLYSTIQSVQSGVTNKALLLNPSGGTVGVNTTTPIGKFDVGGFIATPALGAMVANFSDNVNAISGIEMSNRSTGVDADFRFLISDAGGHYFAFASSPTSNTGTLFGLNRSSTDYIFNSGGTARDIAIGTVANSSLVFSTNNSEKMRILGNGNVGIGNTGPSYSLDVTGDIRATASIISPYIIGGILTTSDLYFKTTTAAGASGADMHFLVGNNGATEAITILNDGKVGINNPAPSEALDVNGNIETTGSIKFGNGFVFEPATGTVTVKDSGSNTIMILDEL